MCKLRKPVLLRINHAIFILAFLVLMISSSAWSAIFENGKKVHITQLQNVADDLYVLSSDSLVVDGSIEGDLTAMIGGNFFLHGEVGQSANIACPNIFSSGTIKGSFRAISDSVNVDGYVGGSTIILADKIVFESGSVVERSADLYGSEVTLDGSIKGKTAIRARSVTITGLIVGDLRIIADRIVVASPAIIRGNFTYVSDQRAEIDEGSGVRIVGDIFWDKEGNLSTESDESGAVSPWILTLSRMLAAFLFGIVILKLFKQYAKASYEQIWEHPSVSFATGVVTMVGVLLSLFILACSGILLLLGVWLTGEGSPALGAAIIIVSTVFMPVAGFGLLSGGLLFYAGVIVVGLATGLWLLAKLNGKGTTVSIPAMLLGLLVITPLFVLPYSIGTIIYCVGALAGSGAILRGVYKCHCRNDNISTSPNNSEEQPSNLPELK